jgi:urease accessory protein
MLQTVDPSGDVTADDRAFDVSGTLSLLQLTDSAFPSGRFTHSYGLETYVQTGLLRPSSSPTILVTLLSETLRQGVAPSDGVALACAHRAVHTDGSCDLEVVRRADRRLSAVKLASELRNASTRIGRALLSNARAVFSDQDLSDLADLFDRGTSPGNQAVVIGVLTARLGVPRVEAVAGELFAFAASWIAAGVRLGVTDHRAGQRILRCALPTIGQAALRAASRDVEDISSCTPLLDVMAMRHEQAELRLFAS